MNIKAHKTVLLAALFATATQIVGCTQEASRKPAQNVGQNQASQGENGGSGYISGGDSNQSQTQKMINNALDAGGIAAETAKSAGKSVSEQLSAAYDAVDNFDLSEDTKTEIKQILKDRITGESSNNNSNANVDPSVNPSPDSSSGADVLKTPSVEPTPITVTTPYQSSSQNSDANPVPSEVNVLGNQSSNNDSSNNNTDGVTTQSFSSHEIIVTQATLLLEVGEAARTCYLAKGSRLQTSNPTLSENSLYYVFNLISSDDCASLKGLKVMVLESQVSASYL